MKTTVTGKLIGMKQNVLYNAEYLSTYLSIFGKYFDSMGNCMYNVDITNMENAVLIFSKIAVILPGNDERTDRVIEIPDIWNYPDEDPIWEHPYQNAKIPISIRLSPDEYSKKISPDSVIITLRNTEHNWVIGEFDTTKKILLLSDVAHISSKVDLVEKILNILEASGLITVRKVEKKKPKIMLGADPELEFIDDTGKVVPCNVCGIEDRVCNIPGSSSGRIGRDGSGAQRELRPEPADTPEGVVKNIEYLIKEGIDEQWSLVGEQMTLGGHIHVGGVEESRDFGRILDHLFKPLMVLNSPERQNSRYGKPGSDDSIRSQKYGVEWRTPPSAWLASKRLTELTFKIVKFAAEKHYSGEDVELTDNVSDDLKNIGLIDEEVTAFLGEIKSLKLNGLPRDLKAAWGIKNPNKFILEIRDGWTESIRKYVRETVMKYALENNLEGRCVLYGVASERGNVFSVVMQHMNGIDEMPEYYGFMPPIKKEAGVNHVGIPASIRGDLSEAKKNMNLILEIVKRTINPPAVKPKTRKPRAKRVASVASENVDILSLELEE